MPAYHERYETRERAHYHANAFDEHSPLSQDAEGNLHLPSLAQGQLGMLSSSFVVCHA